MSMVRPTPMKPKPVKQSRQRKGLRRVSRKMAPRLRQYYRLREAYLTRLWCEFPRCTERMVDIHHVQGRGANLLNLNTWMGLCRKHHDWIHSHPNQARKRGLLA